MKKQILMLVIGILIGAIITTGVFLVLKGNTSGYGDRMNMRDGDYPNMDGNTMKDNYDGERRNQRQNGNTTNDTEINNIDANETEL